MMYPTIEGFYLGGVIRGAFNNAERRHAEQYQRHAPASSQESAPQESVPDKSEPIKTVSEPGCQNYTNYYPDANEIRKNTQNVLLKHQQIKSIEAIRYLPRLPASLDIQLIPTIWVDNTTCQPTSLSSGNVTKMTLPEFAVLKRDFPTFWALFKDLGYPLMNPLSRDDLHPLIFIAEHHQLIHDDFFKAKVREYRLNYGETTFRGYIDKIVDGAVKATVCKNLMIAELISFSFYKDVFETLAPENKLILLQCHTDLCNDYNLLHKTFTEYYSNNKNVDNYYPRLYPHGIKMMNLASVKAYIEHCQFDQIQTMVDYFESDNSLLKEIMKSDDNLKSSFMKIAKNRILKLVIDNPDKTLPPEAETFLKKPRTYYFCGLIPGAFFYTSSSAILSQLKSKQGVCASTNLKREEAKITAVVDSLSTSKQMLQPM